MPADALSMPAIQFFKLLELGEEMHSFERNMLLCDLLSIEAVNIADFNYYKRIDARFRSRIEKSELPHLPDPSTRPTPRPAVQADSADAMNMLTGLFGGRRGR